MRTIRSRLLLSSFLLLVGFGAVFTTLYYLDVREEIIRGFDERLRSHATDIAALIDVETHERLREPGQMQSDDYRRLYGELNGLMKRSGLAFIFTIRNQNGQWVYVLDSGEGANHLPVGALYNEGRPLETDEEEALTGRTVVSSVYTSRYGTFKSAYTPLRDRSGRIVGLLVVDIEASTITATLRSRLVSLVALYVAVLLLIVLLAGPVSGSITRPLHRMAVLAGRIADGDLDTPMATNRRDEIGVVSRALDSMVRRLKQIITEKEAVAGELARFNLSLEALVQERSGALAESEARYRLLTEQSALGIYLIQDGRFRYVNPTLAEMVGRAREDLIGREVASLAHPDDRETFLENVRQRIEGEVDHLRYQLRVVKPDGPEILMEVSGARSVYQGRPAIHGTARDVTEQRRLEEMLRRSQRLEGLGQMAGGIAHEFNNLMTPILGYTDLLKQRLASMERPDLLRPLTFIEKAGARAKALVREILTFARGTSYPLSPVNLNDVVEQTVALFQRTVPRNVEVRTDLAPDLPPVEAEPGQMQSALLNLCLNARDAMPEGGLVVLSTSEALLTDESRRLFAQSPPGRYVEVSVRDTGTGIEASVIPRIFDPFFTTKKASGGTGLGLSAVYGTVQSHRGQVAVESRPGQGTLFRIVLPATDKPVGAAPAKAAPWPRGDERVLVVDDEEDVRSLFSEALEELGYHVIQARDGEAALDALADESIRLVLLDMNMPRLDGRQTLAAIRATRLELPVVITSGLGERGAQDLSDDTRLTFLSKPFGLEVLATTVREMLDASAGDPGVHRDPLPSDEQSVLQRS